jgi:pimeloyl-ACP methyl ester carboxylesterase
MVYLHEDIGIQAFRDGPASLDVDGWQVDYMSFCRPENTHKTPLIILGGAFQVFHSFINDVKAYLPHLPVILVALPGQASNRDPKHAEALELEDMSRILYGFMQRLKHPKVRLIGFSYGSLIAYDFAARYEECLHQLVLSGCSLEMRHTLRELMRIGAKSFTLENQAQVSEAISQSLFNIEARDQTGLSLLLVERLTQSIRKLRERDIRDYQANTYRLLRSQLPLRLLKVSTLVLTAQYDHFVMPHESLAVTKHFTNHRFALIEQGDHLVPLLSPQLVYRTILAFLNEQSLEAPGVRVDQQAKAIAAERRRSPRHESPRLPVMIHNEEGSSWSGQLHNISIHGAGVSIVTQKEANLEGLWYLSIDGQDVRIPGFLSLRGGRASFVFYRESFSVSEKIRDIVSHINPSLVHSA